MTAVSAAAPEPASRASLAVTLTRSEASYGTRSALTEVFGTADGGHSWTRSAPVHAPGVARWLAFSDPAHGWLLQDLGAAIGNNPVRLYRISDGGRHWLLIAASPRCDQARTGPGTLPSACDKTGIGFATPTDGWLTGTCFPLADAVLATHGGGAHWAPQPLPLAANACMPDSCFISPPQFFRSTGFLTIDHGGRAPYLLVSHDTGTTWHPVAVPQAAGPFGSARFFSARQGLLIPAASQDTPGRVFYLTSDGGQTRTPASPGTPTPWAHHPSTPPRTAAGPGPATSPACSNPALELPWAAGGIGRRPAIKPGPCPSPRASLHQAAAFCGWSAR